MKILFILLITVASASRVFCFQQARFIQGKVLNTENNESIPFASLVVLQSNVGTASDIDGTYFLRLDSADLYRTLSVSCIGFKTRQIRLDSLSTHPIILLAPEVQLLTEVVVQGEAADAREILQQAIDNIPQNYLQSPFNMEFYAITTVTDTVTTKAYSLESVFMSYYEGYHESAQKNYKIVHKRETGEYFMKEKTHGMSQWPMWELALNDIFSNQTKDQIATVESLETIKPKLVGTQRYEGDTVFVIKYHHQHAGTIYISSRDYAILKHSISSSGRGYANYTEIVYRKDGGKYFPYAVLGDYVHQYKVGGKKKMLKISNRARLGRVIRSEPISFEHRPDLWVPKNVAYDKIFWENNYPALDVDQ